MEKINEIIKFADPADEYKGDIGKEQPSQPGTQPKSTPAQPKQPPQPTQSASGTKPTTTKPAVPVSIDIKSKIVELQQAILEFKNVAQSTDFGSFENPGVRDLTPEITAQDKEELDQVQKYQDIIDSYYRGGIKLTNEELAHMKSYVNDHNSKIGFGKSLQGNKPMGDFFLQKYMAPVSDKAKIWKQKTKDAPEQYVQVEMPTAQRGMKGSGAVAPIDFKGIIETIGRIGTPKTSWRPDGEKVPDGIFDIRTYNAIANIFVVTKAFVNIAKDFRSSS